MKQSQPEQERCYLCGAEATSTEHAPALCFFPESAKFRVQLITVPSCEAHNQATSSDDEYVRNFVTTHHTNNNIAFGQFTRKVVKSLRRNKWMHGQRMKIPGPKGLVYAIQIQRDRFDRVVRKIGYATYYYRFRAPWNRELNILTRHLLYRDLSPDDYGIFLDSLEDVIPPLPLEGNNPKVFKYAFLGDGTPDETVLCMTFYEGFTVWLTPREGSTSSSI